MDGKEEIDPTINDTHRMTQAVYEELIALRGTHGKLTVEKISRYPNLRLVCGDSNVLVAFLIFERELQRFIRRGNRNEVAAALSIAAPFETVLERFEEVLGHFEEAGGEDRNQRTARRWSDQGMRALATELVHLADVQIRLGSELITVELSGNYEDGIFIEIYQLTTRHTDERAPLIRVWYYPSEDVVEGGNIIIHDLDQVKSSEGTKGPFRLRFHAFRLDTLKGLDKAPASPGETVYRFSIEGRDAPLRSVSFQNDSDLSDYFSVRFTAHLTDATIEVTKRSSKD